MHSHLLDNYSGSDSPVHRLPAALKLTAVVATIVILVTVPPSPVLFSAVGAMLVLTILVSRVPIAFLAKRMLLLEPFVIGICVLSLLQPNGGRICLVLATRTTLCLLTVLLLSNTTSFSDLLIVLRRLHVPMLMVTTLALMYRYLYVLGEETERMRRARASRSFTRGRWRVWSSLATIIAQLFVRCTGRADRIYAAMCARGWR